MAPPFSATGKAPVDLRGAYYTASMSSLHSLAFLSLHRVMFVACLRQWRGRFSDTLKCQSCSDIPLSRDVVMTTILPFLSQIYLCVRFYASSHRVIRRTVRHFFRRYRLYSLQDSWARRGRPPSVLLNSIGLRPSSLPVSMKREMRSSVYRGRGQTFRHENDCLSVLVYTSSIDRLSFMSLVSPE